MPYLSLHHNLYLDLHFASWFIAFFYLTISCADDGDKFSAYHFVVLQTRRNICAAYSGKMRENRAKKKLDYKYIIK